MVLCFSRHSGLIQFALVPPPQTCKGSWEEKAWRASGLGEMYSAKHTYKGSQATSYEANREKQPAWRREIAVINKLCREWLPGSTILDIPSGTGRLFPVFQRHGHQIWGGDISIDMLKQVSLSHNKMPGLRGLAQLEAEHLPFVDDSFDYVVCARFFHWGLPIEVAETILHEYTRIARKGIILHGPMLKRGPLARTADAVAVILHSRWGAPGEIARQTRQVIESIKHRLEARLKRTEGSPSSDSEPIFSCSPPELERVVGSAGFSVTRSYGAVSPFSSKRIYLIENNNLQV